MSFNIFLSLLLLFCDLCSMATPRNQNLFNEIYHTAGINGEWFMLTFYIEALMLGFEKISRGKLAATIPWMLQTHNISFYFKVNKTNYFRLCLYFEVRTESQELREIVET